MKDNELLNKWQKIYDQPFKGWDFSAFADKIAIESLSWKYKTLVRRKMQNSLSMLDMGTGGGEFLSSLAPFPDKTMATEAYPPNVPIAKERLNPLGIDVVSIQEDHHLPFLDDEFDLIINRHESYDAKEVFRILEPNGFFLTQQVGGKNDLEINKALGAPLNQEYYHWDLEFAIQELNDIGFQILTEKEEHQVQQFYDIESLIYFLKAIPWQVPDFTVKKYFNQLKAIDQHIHSHGSFRSTNIRFLIIAQKP